MPTNKLLSVNPDRYGRFGHQTLSITTGILTSIMTGSKLLLPRYMYFSDKWNKLINWKNSRYVSSKVDGTREVYYLESSKTDTAGNRKWNLDKSEEIDDYLTKINSISSCGLIELPFDQHPGIMLRLYEIDIYKRDLKNVFESIVEDNRGKKKLTIHIRRGDVSEDRHPDWYIKDEVYFSLISALDRFLPEEWEINICTQGEVKQYETIENRINKKQNNRLNIHTTDELFINDSEVDAFTRLFNSEIIITSGSSFGFWAALAGKAKVHIDISRRPRIMRSTYYISPDKNVESITNEVLQILNRCSITSS